MFRSFWARVLAWSSQLSPLERTRRRLATSSNFQKRMKLAAFHGHMPMRILSEIDKLLVGHNRAGDHGTCVFYKGSTQRVITGVIKSLAGTDEVQSRIA